MVIGVVGNAYVLFGYCWEGFEIASGGGNGVS